LVGKQCLSYSTIRFLLIEFRGGDTGIDSLDDLLRNDDGVDML